jgi:lysine 6-dehydrogenase
MKILVLGAAGAMARVSVRDLLSTEEVERIGLADLSLERVKDAASRLGDDRLEPLRADVKDEGELARVMSDWDAVINSTWYELNLEVMGAAIRSGINYLDLGGLYHMTLRQLAMDHEAKDAGVTCILGLGSSPGVTNLMASLGATRLSSVEEVKIRVGGASPRPSSGLFTPPYSFRTILDEACLPAVVLRGGAIEEVPGLSVREEFSLPDPVGKVEGYYTLHSELATLPQNLGKGVQEMNFIVAFSPEFSRAVALLVKLGLAGKDPLSLPGGGTVIPYDLLTRLVDALPTPTEHPADFGVRRVELNGEEDGQRAHLVYDCISGPHEKWKIGGRALGTGVPASLGAQWLARGSVKVKGVLPPEKCIDPGAFLHELSENGRGIATYEDDGKSRRQI